MHHATDSWDATTVASLIDSGALAEASERIAAVLKQQPGFLPARLARGRLFVAEGRAGEAVELLAPLLEGHPGNLWVLAALVDALIESGRVDEGARRLVDELLPAFADRPEVMALLNRAVVAVPEPGRRIELLEMAKAAAPKSQGVMVKLAAQLFAAGRLARAKALFEAAQALGPLPAFAETLRIGLLVAEADYEAAMPLLTAARAGAPDNSDLVRRLVRVAQGAGRFDISAATLAEAVERWPDLWLVLYRYNRTFLDEADDAAIYDRLAAFAAASPTTDMWRFQFALAAARRGNHDGAMAMLDDLCSSSRLAPMAGPARAGLAGALRDARGRSLVGRDRAVGIEVVPRQGAEATLVVLSSLVGGVGYVPAELVARVLHDLPANIVVLRDRRGLGFLKGVTELGPDEAAMASAVRATCARLGARRTVTLGSSLAGYAALRLALAIDADVCLSFAGRLDLGGDEETETGHAPAHGVALREMQAVADGSSDLRPRLAAAQTLRFTLVAGADCKPDRATAARLEGITGARSILLAGVDHHFSAMSLFDDGTFAPLVRQTIAGEA